MSRQVIHTENAPAAIGTYSQAILVDNTLYLSGQIGLDPYSMEMVEGIEAQIRRVFDNLKAVCEAAGGSLAAFGAYSAATTFATASTGTAIASLSGAAASNATLAFFGGGSLAAGGLGMAGGAAVLGGLVAGPALLVMGIIIGALGPKLHFISYTTRSASLMLRKLGLSLYLACLGLDAGKDFFSTVVRPEGIAWVGIGFLITVVPIIIIGLIALKTHKFDFGTICGILCGSMANPMALGYANDSLKTDSASISYASVYPLGMFVRVIIAQMIIMFLA